MCLPVNSIFHCKHFNRDDPFCLPTELLAQGLMSKAVDVYAYGVLLWELYVGDRWVQRTCRRT